MPQPAIYFFFLRNVPPTDDLNVRKALIHGVDWNKVIAAAWEGTRNDRVQTGTVTPEHPCYKKDVWPEFGFNAAKAKEELAKSKYGSADKLGKIRITPGGQTPSFVRTAEAFIEQWKTNLGITDAELNVGGADAWGQDRPLINVQRSSWGGTILDPAFYLAGWWNYYNRNKDYQDEQADKMLAQLATMKRDDPKYCEAVQAAEAKLLGNYPILPMVFDKPLLHTKSWLKGVDTNSAYCWYTLPDVYIAKH